jgi:hypothetical protein
LLDAFRLSAKKVQTRQGLVDDYWATRLRQRARTNATGMAETSVPQRFRCAVQSETVRCATWATGESVVTIMTLA